ncbi:MAG TPA: hypothetical protein VGJ15_04850, partial [Pirellulales bacterium]
METWLRGSGNKLELCLHGEILDADGHPATDCQLAATIQTEFAEQRLQPSIEGNQFKLWMPINQREWFRVSLDFSGAQGKQFAFRHLNQHQLRQAAIDGMKVALQTPTRHMKVNVTDQGERVVGATVKAEWSFGRSIDTKTDAQGVAHIDLLPQDALNRLTAWTDDHRLGGYMFDRSPQHDPEANEFTVELSKCRDQKIRFVAEDGSPAMGLEFILQVATPAPDYNFIGQNENSHLKTDANGEAICRWFPDWPQVQTDFKLNRQPWVLVGKPNMLDGVLIVKVKKAISRQQITGHVVADGTGTCAGGFYVELWSFKGEQENNSDVLYAVANPDGTFTANALPDATYCAFVLDERWVGEMIDLVPYDSATAKVASAELHVAAGQPVEIVLTAGPNNQPIVNQPVSFSREHEYSWSEGGRPHRGTGQARWWSVTDESGKATAFTLPGSFRASVYTPR